MNMAKSKQSVNTEPYVFPFNELTNNELHYTMQLSESGTSNNTLNLNTFLEETMNDNNDSIPPIPEDTIDQLTITNQTSHYTTIDEIASAINLSNTFMILHINCRSLNKNFDKIKHLLQQFPALPAAITLSETWINNEETNNFYSLKNYTFISKARTEKKRGGGVAIYLLNQYTYTVHSSNDKFLKDVGEYCTIEIEMEKSQNIILTSLYKPPDVDIKKFTTSFTKFLKELTSSNKITIVAGDTNIDLLKHETSENIGLFLQQIISFGLLPTVTIPTRITQTTATLIDNIFVNQTKNEITSKVIFEDISDHLPILTAIKLTRACP